MKQDKSLSVRNFKKKKCLICQGTFQPTNRNQKTCSIVCSKMNRKRYESKNKRYFADATRKYAHNNRDKIREKA